MRLVSLARPAEHLFHGIGWYLYNGDLVRKFSSKILYVGTLEKAEESIDKIYSKLSKTRESKSLSIYRKSSMKYPTKLSKKAALNIRTFLLDSDYMALLALRRTGHITKETFSEYWETSGICE